MVNSIEGIPQVLERVESEILLAQVYKLEPQRLEQIVDLALMCECPDERWQNYERLKKVSAQFVGFSARRNELRTYQHYEVMLGFIDWLLPDN